MEKNSFEAKLHALLQDVDENTSVGEHARERVWGKVKTQSRASKRYWFGAAAAVLIGILGIFLQPNHEVSIATKVKKGKSPDRKTQMIANTAKSEKRQSHSPQEVLKQLKPNHRALTLKQEVSASKTTQEVPLRLLETKLAEQAESRIAIVNLTPETQVQPMGKEENKAEFTVQFKRGKPILPANYGSYTNLLTFKLKRDTTYLANAEEKQPVNLKLGFKNEN